MNHCSTCKHWGASPYWYYSDDDDADDAGEPTASVHRICGAMVLLDPPSAVAGKRLPVFLRDGSGYKAEAWTEPTFGCVLHDAKS